MAVLIPCDCRIGISFLPYSSSFFLFWQEDDDMLVPPQDFNDVIEPMEGAWKLNL